MPQRIFDLWDEQVGSDQEVPGEAGCKPSRIDRLTTGRDKGVALEERQEIIGLNAMFSCELFPGWLYDEQGGKALAHAHVVKHLLPQGGFPDFCLGGER